MSPEILDFDNIDEWAIDLENVLSPLVTTSIRRKLAESNLQYVEDTRDLLFRLTDRDAVIDTVLDWLSLKNIAGYHGTRITDSEVASIQKDGLLPLIATARRSRLARALSSHPKWNEIAKQLDEAIQSHGQGIYAGQREGQVHLTLSMAGLLYGFNHYLVYGSEFDQHVAQMLLGQDALKLLSLDGEPKVIKVAVPGDLALNAAHPFFSVDDMRERGSVPNIVNEFLEAWTYRLSHTKFQSRRLKVDCGMIFRNIVSTDWIMDISTAEIPLH